MTLAVVASPQHIAVRLCLTVESKISWRLRLRFMRRSLMKERHGERRKGRAFPHYAAAEPRWFI